MRVVAHRVTPHRPTDLQLRYCSHRQPSKAGYRESPWRLQVLPASGLKKLNGICSDTGNDHRVEARCAARITPDSDVKDDVRQWSALNEGEIEARRSRTIVQRLLPSEASLCRWLAELLERGAETQAAASGTVQADARRKDRRVQLAKPVRSQQSRRVLPESHRAGIPRREPSVAQQLFQGKPTEFADDVDAQFTQTLDMTRTGNAGQAAPYLVRISPYRLAPTLRWQAFAAVNQA